MDRFKETGRETEKTVKFDLLTWARQTVQREKVKLLQETRLTSGQALAPDIVKSSHCEF